MAGRVLREPGPAGRDRRAARGALPPRFLPILYTDTWGDYFGIWSWGSPRPELTRDVNRRLVVAEHRRPAIDGARPGRLARSARPRRSRAGAKHRRACSSRCCRLVCAGGHALLRRPVTRAPTGTPVKAMFLLTAVPAWAISFGFAADVLLAREPARRRTGARGARPVRARRPDLRDVRHRLVSEWVFLRAGLLAVAVLVLAALVGWRHLQRRPRRSRLPKDVEVSASTRRARRSRHRGTRSQPAPSSERSGHVVETNGVTASRGQANASEARRIAESYRSGRRRTGRPARDPRPDGVPVGSTSIADPAADDVRLHLLSRRVRLSAVTAVLFTCAGQRVDIVSAFARAGATTVATDADPMAPALYHADAFALVAARSTARATSRRSRPWSRSTTSSWSCPSPTSTRCCSRSRATRSRPRWLLSPSPRCAGRWATSTRRISSSRRNGIASPRSWLPDDVPDDARYPLLVKVREGFGSRHIYRAKDRAELDFFLGYTTVDSFVQELLPGRGVLRRRLLRLREHLPERDPAHDDPVEGRRVDQGRVDQGLGADRARAQGRRDRRHRRPGEHPVLPRARRRHCRSPT